MAPVISPNKTWSGFFGGLVFAFLLALLGVVYVGLPQYWLWCSVLLALGAHGGDFLESWVKRHCGVKDSGMIFPGHGGVLDRLDSVMGAGIVMWGVFHVFAG